MAVLVLATGFSGCAGHPSSSRNMPGADPESTGTSIFIPTFREGDEWRTRVFANYTDHEGVQRRETSEQETRWLEGLQRVDDAYGHDVPGYLAEVSVKEEPEEGQPFLYPFMMSVEANRNAWLAEIGFALLDRYHEFRGGLGPFSATCRSLMRGYNVLLFDDEPRPLDAGTLRNRTLRLGETFDIVLPTRSGTLTRHVRPYERLEAQLGSAKVAAMRVNETITFTSGANTFTSYSEAVYVHMVPVPLRVSVAGGEFVQVLLSYTAGTTFFRAHPGVPAAQYNGTNRDATSAHPVLMPPEGAPVEFPASKAIEVARSSPGAASFQVWSLAHSDVYVMKGVYHRDVPNGTYEWELWFTDGREVMIVQVRSIEPGEGVPPVSYAVSGQPIAAFTATASPSEFRALKLEDFGLGRSTSSRFLQRPAGWDYAGWNVGKPVGGQAAASYFAALGYHYRDPGVPFEYESKGYGWAPNVRADTGRIANDAHGTGRCGSAIPLLGG